MKFSSSFSFSCSSLVDQLSIWPFPVMREAPTNTGLTALFLAFAQRDDLSVGHDQYNDHMKVSCAMGSLKYRLSSSPGRVASSGTFQLTGGPAETWNDELPSRWAVRQLVRAVNRKRFSLGVQP